MRALLLCTCSFLVALALAVPAHARGGARGGDTPVVKEVAVPDVGGLHLAEARKRLEAAGFVIGRIEQYTPAQVREIFDRYGIEGVGVLDHVFQQNPKPGVAWRTDRPIDLRVCAREAGVRQGVPGREAKRRVDSAREEAPPGNEPPEVPEVPAREVPDAPRDPVPVGGQTPDPEPIDPNATYAQGSPEAPRVVREDVRTDVVPSLLGLRLSAAEQLVLDAGMKLHVDRVAGHPIGRVLEQAPSAGGRRPVGGVVRVVVTAGGDFDGEQTPIAPEVVLAKVVVPGLLDRTRLQATRIIEDLGLKVQEEKARRGLPGRVVDQMPPSGGRVPRGGIVRIWIGPGEVEGSEDSPPRPGPLVPRTPEPAAGDAPTPETPSEGDTPADGTPKGDTAPKDPVVPAPKPPLAPGPLPSGVPKPLAPGHGTVIPREETVPIGFTWRGVKGAEAYILEIEEEGAEGRWMANARKPSKKTAVILEVERISTRHSGRLRWRVSAVVNGRNGTPSKWIVLK